MLRDWYFRHQASEQKEAKAVVSATAFLERKLKPIEDAAEDQAAEKAKTKKAKKEPKEMKRAPLYDSSAHVNPFREEYEERMRKRREGAERPRMQVGGSSSSTARVDATQPPQGSAGTAAAGGESRPRSRGPVLVAGKQMQDLPVIPKTSGVDHFPAAPGAIAARGGSGIPSASQLDRFIEETRKELAYADIVRKTEASTDSVPQDHATEQQLKGHSRSTSKDRRISDVEGIQEMVGDLLQEEPQLSPDEISDLVTAAVLQSGLDHMDGEEAEEVAEVVRGTVIDTLIGALQDEASDFGVESVPGSESGVASRGESKSVRRVGDAATNIGRKRLSSTLGSVPSKPSNRALPEVAVEKWRQSDAYKDRTLVVGSQFDPYSRGHLVTASNNNSVNTVLKKPGGKKAEMPIRTLVDLYVLPKLQPSEVMGYKSGRAIVATRQSWNKPTM
ncbi:unnamed protein product [Amoebophrya sp. A25]|nr:unnamed protein product [Amoebophrya sp. A25]|eukprot:GSA25T00006254001.1